MWVRGGAYPSRPAVTISVSGAAGARITFRQYPGEIAILDGSIAEFTASGNQTWQPDGELSSDFDVYRSVNAFPVSESLFYCGFIQLDGQ